MTLLEQVTLNLLSDSFTQALINAHVAAGGQTALQIAGTAAQSMINMTPTEKDPSILSEAAKDYLIAGLQPS